MTGQWQTLVNETREWGAGDARWPDIVRRSELLLIRMAAGTVNTGAIDSAMEFYRSVPWNLLNLSFKDAHPRWMLRIGRILDRFGRRDAAADMFNNAVRLAGENTSPRLTCIALMEQGELSRRQGDLSGAYLSQGRAMETARQNHLDREEADALNNLAIAAVESGHLNRAEDLLRDSLKLAEKISEKRLVGHIYNNLGVILCMKNVFQGALVEFARAIPCREAVNDAKGLSETYHNMSVTYKDMNDINRAEHMLEKALEITRKLNDKGQEANILLTRIELLILSGDDPFALSLAEQLADMQSQLKDLPGLAENHKLMANIYHRQNNLTEAVRHLEESVCTFRSLGILLGEAESLKELGSCVGQQGRVEDAAIYFRQSLKLFESLGNRAEQDELSRRLQSIGS